MGNPRVGVIMGSDSDLPTMQGAIDVLAEFDVPYEARVISAHRTPEAMLDYARGAVDRGLDVIIAGAGGAAHLPGMTASMTPLPVIGVPVALQELDGLDSLLSIVQMPAGIPVATVAIGNARNAGLLAVRILAVGDEKLRAAMVRWEAAIIALFGTLLGIAMALFFGWAVVRALHDQGFTKFSAAPVSLVVIVVITGLATLVWASLPARRAARLDVLKAIEQN